MTFIKLDLMTVNKIVSTLFITVALIACQQQSSAEDASSLTLTEKYYNTLASPITPSTKSKIEVVELFWYGCGHCFALEPHIEKWKKDLPENVKFVKVPAIFNSGWEFHAKVFYAMEALGILDEAHDDFFKEIHVKGKRMGTVPQVVAFMEKYGKTEKEITAALNSFSVDSKVRNAKMISYSSSAEGVPAMLVDGKYITDVGMSGSHDKLFEVINALAKKAQSER